MSQTPGNVIIGAGGYGSGVIHPPSSGAWYMQTVGLVGAGVLSLTVAGKLWRPVLALQIPTRLVGAATRPINWAVYNAAREVGDFAHWARGGEMELGVSITGRPLMLPVGYPVFVPFPWLDIQPSQSSGGGGPGGLPNLHQPPPSIEETGEILSNPLLEGGKTGSQRRASEIAARRRILKRTRCPPGHHWSYRYKRCVKTKKYHKG